jgi:TolB protein
MKRTAGSQPAPPADGTLAVGEGDGSEIRLAPHGLRLIGFIGDVFILAIVFAFAFVLGQIPGAPVLVLYAAAGITFVYYLAATVWLMEGQTAAKAVCGLRVRRIDGRPLSRSLRDLIWSFGRHSVGYLVADVLLLGTALALVTKRRRCLHDYAFGSETVLVGRGDPGQPAWDRYRAFWKLFMARYDEVKAEYRWILFPWKWLTAVMLGVVVYLKLIGDAWAAAPSPPASAAPAAKALPLKATAALWTVTTVATGVIVAMVVPKSDPIRNINVVVSFEDVGAPATAELYMMKANGKQLHRLTRNDWSDQDPDLFGDRRVAFTSDRDGNRDVYLIDVDGTGSDRLTESPQPDWCPDWSPDGKRIAFTSDRDGNSEIYVMNADGSAQSRLTDHAAADWCPDWSPDGRQIAFTSGRDGSENVYEMNSDGMGVVQLSTRGGRDPAWSPDMTAVVFSSDRDGNENIYVIGVDGRGERRLTVDAAADYEPFWAPDGSKILFSSLRDLTGGAGELYVMELDGSGQTKLTSLND